MIALKGLKEELTVKAVAQMSQDNGRTMPVEFRTKWKKMQFDEAKRVNDMLTSGAMDELAVCDAYLLDITDLRGEAGDVLEYSRELIEEMLQHREYRMAIIQSFYEVQLGRQAFLAKNS